MLLSRVLYTRKRYCAWEWRELCTCPKAWVRRLGCRKWSVCKCRWVEERGSLEIAMEGERIVPSFSWFAELAVRLTKRSERHEIQKLMDVILHVSSDAKSSVGASKKLKTRSCYSLEAPATHWVWKYLSTGNYEKRTKVQIGVPFSTKWTFQMFYGSRL